MKREDTEISVGRAPAVCGYRCLVALLSLGGALGACARDPSQATFDPQAPTDAGVTFLVDGIAPDLTPRHVPTRPATRQSLESIPGRLYGVSPDERFVFVGTVAWDGPASQVDLTMVELAAEQPESGELRLVGQRSLGRLGQFWSWPTPRMTFHGTRAVLDDSDRLWVIDLALDGPPPVVLKRPFELGPVFPPGSGAGRSLYFIGASSTRGPGGYDRWPSNRLVRVDLDDCHAGACTIHQVADPVGAPAFPLLEGITGNTDPFNYTGVGHLVLRDALSGERIEEVDPTYSVADWELMWPMQAITFFGDTGLLYQWTGAQGGWGWRDPALLRVFLYGQVADLLPSVTNYLWVPATGHVYATHNEQPPMGGPPKEWVVRAAVPR